MLRQLANEHINATFVVSIGSCLKMPEVGSSLYLVLIVGPDNSWESEPIGVILAEYRGAVAGGVPNNLHSIPSDTNGRIGSVKGNQDRPTLRESTYRGLPAASDTVLSTTRCIKESVPPVVSKKDTATSRASLSSHFDCLRSDKSWSNVNGCPGRGVIRTVFPEVALSNDDEAGRSN